MIYIFQDNKNENLKIQLNVPDIDFSNRIERTEIVSMLGQVIDSLYNLVEYYM